MVIAVAIGLDGGAGSPLAGLLVLPVLFGGLLYRLREVVGLAVLAILSFGLIYATGQSGDSARALASAVMIGVVGSISAMAAMNREIGEEERRALTERLHRLATYDGLTGCLNYQSFQATLINEVERTERYRRPLSVVIADLDGFKAINDRYGHAAGDSALISIASALRAGVRSADLVGRIGGDEFAILLPETLTTDARQLVERLQVAVGGVATPEQLTLSFGLSTWHGPERFAIRAPPPSRHGALRGEAARTGLFDGLGASDPQFPTAGEGVAEQSAADATVDIDQLPG